MPRESYPTPSKGYQPPNQDYLNAENFYLTTTTTLPPPVSAQTYRSKPEISYKSEKPVSMYSFSFTTTYGLSSLDCNNQKIIHLHDFCLDFNEVTEATEATQELELDNNERLNPNSRRYISPHNPYSQYQGRGKFR